MDRLSPFQDQISFYITDGSQASLDMALSESKPDMLIHLAGAYALHHTPEQATELVDTNVAIGTRLLEAAKKVGVSKIINTGSHFQYYESDYPNPMNLYAVTKQAFANILAYYNKEEGFDFLNLIIFESYGPGDWRYKLIQAILSAQQSGKTLSLVPADPVMDFAYIDDIVDAYRHAAQLLENDSEKVNGKSFALSGGDRLRISELVKVFEEVRDIPINTEQKDDPPGVRRILNPWNGPALPGWKPKISMRKGIRKLLENS